MTKKTVVRTFCVLVEIVFRRR